MTPRHRPSLLLLLACQAWFFASPFGCAMEVAPEKDLKPDSEVGVSKQAQRCNDCEEPPVGTGSSGGPPATPSSPDANGWTGWSSNPACVAEFVLHPAGCVADRSLVPALRQAHVLNSRDDCYAMASSTSGIATAVAAFVAGGPLAGLFSQVAAIELTFVHRCVCDEYLW